MAALVHLLYDMAARLQDVVELKVGVFRKWKGGVFDLKPIKGLVWRKVFITDETRKLVNDYTEGMPDNSLLFPCTEKALKCKLHRFFVEKHQTKVTSHDFRKTKATNMYREYKISLLDIRYYLGHSDIKTTQLYVEAESGAAAR